MVKKQGANKLLTNCPPCPLFLEQGLEVMRELGEPMEAGFLIFTRCSQGLLVRRGMGQGGVRVGGGGHRPILANLNWKSEASRFAVGLVLVLS